MVVTDKEFRIAEIFGPTIQGEGKNAGIPCHFVRFGGCDYRCRWCDSPHSVLPELVAQLPKMDAKEIFERVSRLAKGPRWVVLTGGNPALFDLKVLCAYLMNAGYSVMAETQGTVFQPWLNDVDEVCISPKPPSAGGFTTPSVLGAFLERFEDYQKQNLYLKVVVFTDDDYGYAKELHKEFPNQPFFLSVGTDVMQPTVSDPESSSWAPDTVRAKVGDDFKRLAEKVCRDREMRDVKVLPQLHVVAWGVERGH